MTVSLGFEVFTRSNQLLKTKCLVTHFLDCSNHIDLIVNPYLMVMGATVATTTSGDVSMRTVCMNARQSHHCSSVSGSMISVLLTCDFDRHGIRPYSLKSYLVSNYWWATISKS